jgi:cytidine deaminase
VAVNLVSHADQPHRELTAEDNAVIEFARRIVDAHGDESLHTMGAAVRAVDGIMHGGSTRDRRILFDYHPNIRVILPAHGGIRSVRNTALLPFVAVWNVEEGTQPFDPTIFVNPR